MSRVRALTAAVITSLAFSSLVGAQNQLTDVTIEAHIYEPQRLSPTEARIAQLQVPAGFSIQRLAEGLDNPRMVAVAQDGTIYVTQRQPGNLVMMRDLDNDGVIDVQKVVARIRQLHGIETRGGEIYLVDIHRIYVADMMSDGSLGRLRILVRNLPDAGQHPNRTLEFSPQGELFALDTVLALPDGFNRNALLTQWKVTCFRKASSWRDLTHRSRGEFDV